MVKPTVLLLLLLLVPLVENRRVEREVGLKRADRVVGGTEVPSGSVKWLASLQYTASKMHFCGATIINDNWVLTAAHCMIEKSVCTGSTPSSFRVVTGGTDLDAPGLTVRIPEKIVIADYNTAEKYNDLALIKTTTPLVPSTRITGDALRLAMTAPSESAYCKVLGWGTTISGGTTVRKLQMARVRIMSAEHCNDAYRGQGYKIYSSMLCAGGGARDACQGDSGGPLVCEADGSDAAADRVDAPQRLVLVGAVSWGVRCATPGMPGVYANIADMLDWVKTTLESQ